MSTYFKAGSLSRRSEIATGTDLVSINYKYDFFHNLLDIPGASHG